MDNSQIHYLAYDPDAIYREMQTAYIAAGGDVLSPGDEKEILLRSVLSLFVQGFAAVDNALRMDTLRYAVGDYLDIYGEKRSCDRIEASAATATVEITFSASGISKVIPRGAYLTADGSVLYQLVEDLTQTGYAQVSTARIVCEQSGIIGNGLLEGTQMQFLAPQSEVISVYCASDAIGGRDREEDEVYRERIRKYGLTAITTGPASQYEAAAMRVSNIILDAHAVNGGGGVVNMYLILSTQTGADALLDEVRAVLNGQDTRPLTDTVNVSQVQDVSYTLNVQYAAASGSNISSEVSAAVDEYKRWQDNKVGRAFNPDKLMSMIYSAGASRVVWGTGSQFDGGNVEYTEIEEDERCLGTITITEI